MGRLKDKVAVVTGAAQGIGAAYARAFAEEGAKVVVADLADGQSAVDEIKASGGEAVAVKTDITNDQALAKMVETAESSFGPIDVLVNNAAYFAHLSMHPFLELPDEEWHKMMTVNVLGLAKTAKAVVPSMRKAGAGRIINIGSGVVFKGPPGMMHYVASKGAVHALNGSMARELGDLNITVNCIAPGITASEKIAGNESFDKTREMNIQARTIKREMIPEDLVGAAVFFASDESKFITGQILLVDGGAIYH